MKKIHVKNKRELIDIIDKQITLHGKNCDLNFIDVSCIQDMSYLFYGKNFNGDISKWDTSHVKDMEFMFGKCTFNGDIGNWNTSQVVDMQGIFANSQFDKNISRWNVENVEFLLDAFKSSAFSYDLSDWKPYKAHCPTMFQNSNIHKVPYWLEFVNLEERRKAIDTYHERKKLAHRLENNLLSHK